MESGRQWYGRVLVGIANLAALSAAIALPIGYASQDPAKVGQFYIPLAAVLPTTIICASIPILTAVFSIRRLRRRARERRTTASDTPTLLQQPPD
jgi:hypothetical protein